MRTRDREKLIDHSVHQTELEHAADRIKESILGDERTRHIGAASLPEKAAVLEILQKLTILMFPGFSGPRELSEEGVPQFVDDILPGLTRSLFEQVTGVLRYQLDVDESSGRFDEHCAACDEKAARVVINLLSLLPRIRGLLSLDVQAAYDGDPAARDTDDVILSYPGVRALTVYRLAHELYRLEVPLIPRIMSEHAHSRTGIDIHPGARIGKSFFIDHGTGVVIGETAVVGDHCKIYHSVTLGAKSFLKDEQGRLQRDVKRHPTLEDHVTVYAGASILGGDTIIGAGCVINGGVFLTSSVAPGHVVRGPKSAVTLRSNPETPPGGYHI